MGRAWTLAPAAALTWVVAGLATVHPAVAPALAAGSATVMAGAIVMTWRSRRAVRLRRAGVPVSGFRFPGPLRPLARYRYRRALAGFRPDRVLTWMNRASAATPNSACVAHMQRRGPGIVRHGTGLGESQSPIHRNRCRVIAEYVQRNGFWLPGQSPAE